MSGEIKKIDSIRNMAVFQDFQWSTSVRDGGNNVAEFKRINIFYGRNYSGKTTVSRIFRAHETGSISEKYDSPEFQLLFEDGSRTTQDSLTDHDHVIRVFNEDFVRDNLRFIVDDEQTINSFAILGEDNTAIKRKIEQHEAELGREGENTGLIGRFYEVAKTYENARDAYNDRLKLLERKLKDKANKPITGIKHNKVFGHANYNVPKLKQDIFTVTNESYTKLSNDQVQACHSLLNEETKAEINQSASFYLNYSAILTKARKLAEEKIQVSDPIQELLVDSALAMWVRSGRDHHRNKRDTCAFCGNNLPLNLWDKLDRHFNQESEQLRTEIDDLLKSIDDEVQRVPKLLDIQPSRFYSTFSQELTALEELYLTHSAAYCKALASIEKQLKKRKANIFSVISFDDPEFNQQTLVQLRDSYEEMRRKSNEYTTSLRNEQSNARLALRLHEVFTFTLDIDYAKEHTDIELLRKAMDRAKECMDAAREKVHVKRSQISDLKVLLKDERKGADRVNHYLNNYFGHQFLTLRAIADTSEDGSSGYRFIVTRNGKEAFHLSGGESSLIAFCYFMAKLEDIDTKGNQPIIWIDDPISSLDSNHIFFVYSLINANIVTPENIEEDGVMVKRDRFKQLFISTHNLDFLKYLKRLPGARNRNMSQYLMINRASQSSDITLMPRYLKDYVTEFNFLFHQIYKCAHADVDRDDNYDCYYNFGNNARKFLEAYLYYKYPNSIDKDIKLERFFGDDGLAVSLTNRVNNEFSHLTGAIERGVLPVDVPEMKTTANFILQRINEKDPDQYSALLESIGESKST